MTSPYIMRPAELADFDALRSMAVESGAGFTSLPVDEEILRKRLLKSSDSFGGRLDQPEYGKYLMMLENTETGEIGGFGAVKTRVRVKSPFFNHRINILEIGKESCKERVQNSVVAVLG